MNITLNGEARAVPPDLTIAGLLDDLGLPRRGIAVAVDRAVVPRSQWLTEVVEAGCEIDIVTAMQGG